MERFGDTRFRDPKYQGYQLIGDSQFLRFSEQILKLRRVKINGIAHLGFCVSGQKISDLLDRVENNFHETSSKAILMIGTNDLLQQTDIDTMKRGFTSLVDKLTENGVKKLLLLTIPPVPRLKSSCDHWNRLKDFNRYIKSFREKENISVVDAYPHFVCRKRSLSLNKSTSSTSSNGSIDSLSARRASPSITIHERFTSINGGSCPEESRNDLRVSISDHGSDKEKRQSYVLLKYPERTSKGLLKSNRTSRGLLKEQTSLNDSLKRKSYMNSSYEENDSPPFKRRNYSFGEDDHNDRFAEEDEQLLSISALADEIELDLFEEYFSSATGRKDLIHLNHKGLCIIQDLLDDVLLEQ